MSTIRSCDIMMQMCASAKERSHDDWIALLAMADPRFKIRSITTPRHSALSIIDIVWKSSIPDTIGNDELPSSPPSEGLAVASKRDSSAMFDADSSSESECDYIHKRPKNADYHKVDGQGMLDQSRSDPMYNYQPPEIGSSERNGAAFPRSRSVRRGSGSSLFLC